MPVKQPLNKSSKDVEEAVISKLAYHVDGCPFSAALFIATEMLFSKNGCMSFVCYRNKANMVSCCVVLVLMLICCIFHLSYRCG